MDTKAIQVLLVEDNATDALLVEDELAHTPGAHFSVVHLDHLSDALARLQVQHFDVVLLDLSLPDSHGLETFSRLHRAAGEVPIVVLSGRADEDLAVEAVQAGAQDYLVKGRLGEDVLPRSLRYAIERQRAERTLAESEERYRLLIEQSPDGYLVHCDNEIVFANTACLKLFGADCLERLLGRSILESIPPEFHGLVRERIEHAQADGSNPPVEIMGLRLDGTTVAVEATSNAFLHEGRPAVQVVLRDLTERKKTEQHALRTQRMESIGTLAGGIAHDLNNSLGPIIMSLDLLKSKFPDPDSQELLATISSCAHRGADMVRQVLSFARGVEGRRMEVQVRHLVQEVEKIANETFLKNIQIRTIIPNDLWTVLGDPTQLHQVLLNLCVNARDAMPNGGPLTISAENRTLDAHYAGMSSNVPAKAGPYVFLQVRDSGTGIPPDIMEKIFDPFFTTKEVGKGTGLGLSTSLAIVKSHGGFIQADSKVGKGTEFEVYLPALTEPSAAAAAVYVAEMPRGHDELILVVDDETAVRQITQQTLEAYGYRVLSASDGVEAIAIFARQGAEIAAVLTDMMMPELDGPATIRVLRKMNPRLRIITASGLASHGHDAASLGVHHVLLKPYTASTLLQTLKQVLSTETAAPDAGFAPLVPA